MESVTIIYYDDDPQEIINKINHCLELIDADIEIKDDGLEHQGCLIIKVRKRKPHETTENKDSTTGL